MLLVQVQAHRLQKLVKVRDYWWLLYGPPPQGLLPELHRFEPVPSELEEHKP